MTHEELLHAVAPCSLMCYTCPALCDGAICRTAEKLLRYFDGYYDFLDARVPPDNQEYRQMVKGHLARLEKYTVRPCPGCRENPEGHGCIEGCTVLSCVRETGRRPIIWKRKTSPTTEASSKPTQRTNNNNR